MKQANQDKKRIGDLLVEEGLITPDMVTEALKMQRSTGTKIVEVLISLGHLTVDDFVNFLSRQPGIASIDLAEYQIPKEITELIPKEIAIKHEVFPIDKMGKLLTLGMACPLDSETLIAIQDITGLRVKPLLCPRRDVHNAIATYYPKDVEVAPEPVAAPVAAAPDERAKPAPKPKKAPSSAKKDAGRVATSKARSGLKLRRASKLIKDLTSLPALPDTVSRVQASVDDMDVSASDVAEIIVSDPAIAAKVLSVSNSPAYGFASRVESVGLAVSLLGLRETFSIVLSAAVLNLFEITKHFDYKVYWEESMNCAAAARMIGGACGHRTDPSVFTSGLLHDIGRIALLETVPELYVQVPSELTGLEMINAEERIIGITHAEAGYELAQNWELPVEIAEAIRLHHHPEVAVEAKENVAIVSLAETWTLGLSDGTSDKETILSATQDVIALLDMDEAAASRAFDEVAELDTARFAWDHKKSRVPA